MTIRTYRRRSKNDEGKQQFSLDVQTKGADDFIARMDFADQLRVDYVDDGRAGDDFLGRLGLKQLLADAQRSATVPGLVEGVLPRQVSWLVQLPIVRQPATPIAASLA